MSIDLISPSLPAIAHYFNVQHQTAKNLISIYLLGYAFGNFFTGIVTDAWGRQFLMRIHLFGFSMVSLLPALFPYIEILLLSRFLQGLTIGAVAVTVRASFSDILPFEKLAGLGALIVAISSLSATIGPIFGGYSQHYFGWKASFFFLSFITFLLFINIFWTIPETHSNRCKFKMKIMVKNFSEICKNSLFIGIAALMGVNSSILITFKTMGPFLIQERWNYSAIFLVIQHLC